MQTTSAASLTSTYSHGHLIFDVLELGSKNNETIILLHGFPSNAQSLVPIAQQLASEGYRVLVPEQRGYSKKARPKHRRDYRLSELVDDVRALLDAKNIQAAHIVGHDWGGVVAWGFADTHPNRALTLTAVSTPHPRALIGSLFKSKQLLLSWYMVFFQLPWLPELIVKANLKKALVRSGLSESRAITYDEVMKNNARLKGALNWYRALPFTLASARKMGKIQVPTLFVYGQGDAFLSRHAAKATKNWVQKNYHFISQAEMSHWIPEENPKWLAKNIAEFVATTTKP